MLYCKGKHLNIDHKYYLKYILVIPVVCFFWINLYFGEKKGWQYIEGKIHI